MKKIDDDYISHVMKIAKKLDNSTFGVCETLEGNLAMYVLIEDYLYRQKGCSLQEFSLYTDAIEKYIERQKKECEK